MSDSLCTTRLVSGSTLVLVHVLVFSGEEIASSFNGAQNDILFFQRSNDNWGIEIRLPRATTAVRHLCRVHVQCRTRVAECRALYVVRCCKLEKGPFAPLFPLATHSSLVAQWFRVASALLSRSTTSCHSLH